VFGSAKPMQIEKNVAKIEHVAGDYRIIVTVEHLNAANIKQEDAETMPIRDSFTISMNF
jgi:hypothetical protein